jgi:hypothetical protein
VRLGDGDPVVRGAVASDALWVSPPR